MGRRLTDEAHAAVAAVLTEGDAAIDATAGNGHDTLFLAREVGASGHVWAFDVQADALEATRRRLEAAGCAERVTRVPMGHERLAEVVTHAGIAAAMFNLGYLPGGDRTVTTTADHSTLAIATAAGLLMPGGIMTILAYRGHPGGQDEARAIARTCESLAAQGFDTEVTSAPGDGPELWVVRAPAPGPARVPN